MEHKLRSALPPRTAWILIGACVLFWVLSALGLLQMPASVPSILMFFWLYLNALAALASAVAVAAAVAALVLHRRDALPLKARTAGRGPALSALDAAEETGLDDLLENDPLPAVELPGDRQQAAAESAAGQPGAGKASDAAERKTPRESRPRPQKRRKNR